MSIALFLSPKLIYVCIHYVLKFIPNLRFLFTQNLNAWKQMTATAEGPVTVLAIVIATPDGLGTQIVPIVSRLMSQRMNFNYIVSNYD